MDSRVSLLEEKPNEILSLDLLMERFWGYFMGLLKFSDCIVEK